MPTVRQDKREQRNENKRMKIYLDYLVSSRNDYLQIFLERIKRKEFLKNEKRSNIRDSFVEMQNQTKKRPQKYFHKKDPKNGI